jgi:pimeloyl-ACP methyl ester carboxylesterase
MKRIINDLQVFTEGKNDKCPIVFVHGFPFDHLMWKNQIDEFSKEYFCVTYDIRGLGESPVGPGQYTIEMLVDDLEFIIDDLNLNKPVLCGLSMGGYISLRAVERMENKFNALILCDTKSSADDDEGKLKRAAFIKQIDKGYFEEFIESFVTNCFGEDFINKNRKEFEEVVDRSKKNNPLGVKGCLLAMAGRTDTTNYLSKISIPSLIICGEKDKLTPPEVMNQMENQIGQSKFVLIKNAGHMASIEDPETVNNAIKEFLDANEL